MSGPAWKNGNEKRYSTDPSRDDRGTPPSLFESLHAEFSFTVDAAASHNNALLPRYWTEAEDGLEQPWGGESVWCNPPYTTLTPWAEKAHDEADDALVIAMLLPANRCEQLWWQNLIEPFRDGRGNIETRFVRGRPKFSLSEVGRTVHVPFGVVVAIWRPRRPR